MNVYIIKAENRFHKMYLSSLSGCFSKSERDSLIFLNEFEAEKIASFFENAINKDSEYEFLFSVQENDLINLIV